MLAHHASFDLSEPEAMQAALVASLRGSHVLYGSHYFPVRIIRPDPTRPGSPHAMMNTAVAAFPDECVIAINSEGLRFLTLERAPLDNGSFSYGELDGGWVGTESVFTLSCGRGARGPRRQLSVGTLYSSQGADMAALLHEYAAALVRVVTTAEVEVEE